VLVELGEVVEDPLAEAERPVPPERLDLLVLAEQPVEAVGKVVAVAREERRLHRELDAAVGDVDQPAMVRPARPGSVDAPALLFQARGDLDVAGPGDAVHLRADPHRVAQVLESVRADDEVELLVLERVRRPATPAGGWRPRT
jgi:hypothetical protein